MKQRRLGLIVLVAVALLATACRAGSTAKSSSDGGSGGAGGGSGGTQSAAPVASSVVTHHLSGADDSPHTRFRAGKAGTTPIPSGSAANGKLTAQPFDGVPSAGALFLGVGGVASAHYCTASVVHSASGNLIATAGHCVRNKIFGGWLDHILYVPGYHDDIAPYGVWVATTAYVDSRWNDSQSEDADIAFLTVKKLGGSTQTLESITGASTFTASPGYTNAVSVVSYPLTASRPVGCATSTTKFSATQLRLDCSGLPEGASGSPFLASGNRLVGILGGYQQGGSSADTSYSIYFDERIAAVFKAAAGS
ncbi:trypsin-like peptidase domain-containing protein [Catenulispora yoronensis]|uniref:Trypsin-like peptidase domain-containing protein n=1 Tax=Catenulispora yoronensis TaxID=450799 RepID=A0ABN2U661_9ACTN